MLDSALCATWITNILSTDLVWHSSVETLLVRGSSDHQTCRRLVRQTEATRLRDWWHQTHTTPTRLDWNRCQLCVSTRHHTNIATTRKLHLASYCKTTIFLLFSQFKTSHSTIIVLDQIPQEVFRFFPATSHVQTALHMIYIWAKHTTSSAQWWAFCKILLST